MKRVAILLSAVLLVYACGDNETSPSAANGEAEPTTVPNSDGSSASLTGLTQVSGAALPSFETSNNDSAVGLTAPVVVGNDLLTGAEVRFGDSGRPFVVGFYAHWCPHCQADVATLTQWLETNELPTGVDFYAVSVLEEPSRGNHPPEEWLRSEGWQHPIVADTPQQSLVGAFGLTSVPYLVAVDAKNQVVFRHAGSLLPAELAEFFGILLRPVE